ncbi:hypothetical protein RHGRI_034860 [Rhododendron griersonianum]|uniref:Uncharacterized protein n=1 Tax=Rhododendron griersonianum TaxID=479676 RepID=A0AAV6I2T4_9ERIC|nr:hypothetical protein RHGRI_034860 [Rhododendron griersonianum]
MTASESIVTKIIIIPIEAILGKKACECGPSVFLNKQCARNTLPNGSKKSEANKSRKVFNVSTDKRTLYAVDNPNVKPSTKGMSQARPTRAGQC